MNDAKEEGTRGFPKQMVEQSNRSDDNATHSGVKKLWKLHEKCFQNISHNSHGKVKFHERSDSSECKNWQICKCPRVFLSLNEFLLPWIDAGSFISVSFSLFFFRSPSRSLYRSQSPSLLRETLFLSFFISLYLHFLLTLSSTKIRFSLANVVGAVVVDVGYLK